MRWESKKYSSIKEKVSSPPHNMSNTAQRNQLIVLLDRLDKKKRLSRIYGYATISQSSGDMTGGEVSQGDGLEMLLKDCEIMGAYHHLLCLTFKEIKNLTYPLIKLAHAVLLFCWGSSIQGKQFCQENVNKVGLH